MKEVKSEVKVVCPLRMIAYPYKPFLEFVSCKAEFCAWYDAAGQCCCLLSIGRQLDKLQK